MARRKDNIIQQDFSFGSVRKEAIERDDTQLITQSLRDADNTIGLTPGSIEIRPGSVHVGSTAAREGYEVDLGAGRVFDIHIESDAIVIYNADGTEDDNIAVDWSALDGVYSYPGFSSVNFWVVADPDTSSVIIGSAYFPLQALTYDGTWSFGAMNYSTNSVGAHRIPYWNYYSGVTIQPSALTGSITLTASSGIWTDDHEGIRVRYYDREIVLGTRVSATVINATVTEELSPTLTFTFASTTGYQVGDAVEHETLGGQGIITAVTATTVTVLTLEFWDGFSASDRLVSPKAKSTITNMATASPAATFLWTMQLLNPIHGYAGYGEKHMGRLYLCDFPSAPNAFAVSLANSISDFYMGSADGDGFVEQVGANDGGSLLFIVSAEDLIFMTSKGLYVQITRDGSSVTPLNIAPVRFTRVGCAPVRPVAVTDGVVFVDAVGEQIFAAFLGGDQYRSWTERSLTKYHPQHISSPSYLGATSSGSEKPETFIYVVNSDGTAAVCQWDRENNSIGWRPWTTTGEYLSIYQAFGKTYSVVTRDIDSVSTTFRERFETGVFMDCVSSLSVDDANPQGQAGVSYYGGVTAFPTHMDGHTCTVYFENYDMGDRLINASGVPLDDDSNVLAFPDYEGILQIGIPFTMTITPWPRRSVSSFRGKRDVKRIYGMNITVQETGSFTFNGEEYGGYRVGEPLDEPPPLRSEEAGFIIGGRGHYNYRSIVKDRPGPFRMTRLRYKVTV